jgi:arylsulfatase A-like enzyme
MRCVRTERWKFIANFEAAARQETSPDFQNNARGYPEVSMRLQLQGTHPPYELYDLQQDPFEQNNLAESPEHEETVQELKRDLLNWMRETEDPLLQGPVPSGTYLKRIADLKDA